MSKVDFDVLLRPALATAAACRETFNALPELLDDWERMRDTLETVWIYARNEPGRHHDSHDNMADAIVAKESCILCLIEDVAKKGLS